MNEAELSLWDRCARRDETARKELILSYLYLAKSWAGRISRMASWADREDLTQDGVLGLIKAIEKFDPTRGVAFPHYANQYVRGAILDSSELTRDLARQQEEICRKVRQADAELASTLKRKPTIEELAGKTGYRIEQISNAVNAMGVAFAGELSDPEDLPAWHHVERPQQERALMIQDALSRLNEREQSILISYYWEDDSHREWQRNSA